MVFRGAGSGHSDIMGSWACVDGITSGSCMDILRITTVSELSGM